MVAGLIPQHKSSVGLGKYNFFFKVSNFVCQCASAMSHVNWPECDVRASIPIKKTGETLHD